MNPAVSRSSASCVQMGLGWRGSVAKMPLPRCVLRLAPASTAARICSGVAWVWPTATRTPEATMRAICSGAPGQCGETVT